MLQMTIRQKNRIVVGLIILLAATAVFGLLQVAKGARFHQYNFLHLKYNNQLDVALNRYRAGQGSLDAVEETVHLIREQPVACLEEVTFLDKIVLRAIDTYHVVSLCESDIESGDEALRQIAAYRKGAIDGNDLSLALIKARREFDNNSEHFEAPVVKTVNAIIILMIGATVLVTILIVVLSLLINRGTLRSLDGAVRRMRDITAGEGDLTLRIPIDTKDEIAELSGLINDFLEQLSKLVGHIAQNAGLLTQSAERLEQASTGFQDSAHTLSSSSEESAAVVEELNATIENVGEAIKESEAQAGDVRSSAGNMETSIRQLGDAFAAVGELTDAAAGEARNGRETVQPTIDLMDEISGSSDKIFEMVELIKSIAEKTSMLSLNASIEAARAGDAGRGFAVVADEVSKLANQTDTSLKAIEEQVRHAQTTIRNGVSQVSLLAESFTTVMGGTVRINEAMAETKSLVQLQHSGIGTITEKTRQVEAKAVRISDTLTEQLHATQEITRSVTQVSEESQRLNEGIEGLGQLSGDLVRSAHALQDIVRQFKYE
ncbi:MAG: methyl-accepting chemotaxis protein [bacterium]|nr:methyl-accepting chemotaxis protein [bacterium]